MKVLSRLPIIIILLYTIIMVPWKKNPYLFYFRAELLEEELSDYLQEITERSYGEHRYITFVLPQDRTNIYSPDTMKVRLGRSRLEIIGDTDFDKPKFSWNVGYVEYWYSYEWRPLHSKLDQNEAFILPITLYKGKIPREEQTIPLSILPKDMKQGVSGGDAHILSL